MQYLAEVQRRSRGVLGGGRAEFKLLAYQRSEQSWDAVRGEEVIAAPEDVSYNAGVLVMLELSNSKQIQRHSEAGRQIVSLLQNFSRLQEKAKTQEEEIEQWKQSLTYQSQELNRREMEMEVRQEQLQQMEEDFERLEQQRQEIEASREDANRLREEFERRSQELEGAWAQLRGEIGRFEERQAEVSQSAVLDESQTHQIHDVLNRLSGAVAPTESVREQLAVSFDLITQQQGSFDQYWQNLEQCRSTAQHLQAEVDRQAQDLQARWQDWRQTQTVVEQAQAELKAQQSALTLKQDYAHSLSDRLQKQDILYNHLYDLASSSGSLNLGAKVDVATLEKMPLEELQGVVRELVNDLEKVSRFVEDQEEELSLQQQTIEVLQRQLDHSHESDRLRLEAELADERESYEMLNETLVGQRRNLQERQEVLRRHQAILAKREGNSAPDIDERGVDLSPALDRISDYKRQLSQELHSLDDQVQQLRHTVDQLQRDVEPQVAAQAAKFHELRQAEQQWQGKTAEVAGLWARVNLYQEMLQPIQDRMNGLKQPLEGIAGIMGQFQETSDYQLQAIAEMRQLLASLTNAQAPEFISS